MAILILVILGIVQGLTEFLPVSSSGHLVLLYNFFGIKDSTMLLSIILHLATLLAVIIYYRKEIGKLIRHPLCSTNLKIIVTTIFTCLIVLSIYPFVKKSFGGEYLPVCFVLTGIILWLSDIFCRRNKPQINSTTIYDICNLPITYTQAIIIGVAQGIACIPGISRSGTTIGVSKILGLGDISSAYSFLISIPIIIASLLMEILKGTTLTGINYLGLGISFVVCFGLGILCIKMMTKFTAKNSLKIFSIYLFVLSAFLLINSMFLHLF